MIKPLPKWNNGLGEYAYNSVDGNLAYHPFYDYKQGLVAQSQEVGYFVVTPRSSEVYYKFNLATGQRYRQFRYCASEDVWKSYGGEINRPPFSVGVVPRVLDQLGNPQEVIVFGRNSRDDRLQQAVVVGGIVKQYCENFPCNVREKWLSRLLILAVSKSDPDFNEVKNLDQLKQKVNWSKVKAYLASYEGHSYLSDNVKPSYRVLNGVEANAAINFTLEKGRVLGNKDLDSLRRGCTKLFNKTWNDYNFVSKEFTPNTSDQAQVQKDYKKWSSLSGNVIKDESANQSTAASQLIQFRKKSYLKVFKEFYAKHAKSFRTCAKFVRGPNMRWGEDKAWFFSYLSAFFYLDQLGHTYSCSNRSWIKNFRNTRGKRILSMQEQLKNCSDQDFQLAFDKAVMMLSALGRTGAPFYRFIQYDSGYGGSKKRFYSWVYDSGKRLKCERKKDQDNHFKPTSFPYDISWEKRYIQNVKNEDLFIRNDR